MQLNFCLKSIILPFLRSGSPSSPSSYRTCWRSSWWEKIVGVCSHLCIKRSLLSNTLAFSKKGFQYFENCPLIEKVYLAVNLHENPQTRHVCLNNHHCGQNLCTRNHDSHCQVTVWSSTSNKPQSFKDKAF